MFRLSVYTVLLLLTSLCQAQTTPFEMELKQADKLAKEGNYTEALVVVEAVVKNDPLNLPALERKVNLMILEGKEKEITKEINSLIEAYPQQPEYYYLRSVLYLYNQRGAKAIEDLISAEYYQMPQPYLEKMYINRGKAYFYNDEFPQAEEDFKQAVEINPRSATAYHSWGMLKYEEQLYEDAIKYFNKAIQFQDDNAILYYNLGMSYFKTGDKKNACYNFNRSCNLKHSNGCKIYVVECSE